MARTVHTLLRMVAAAALGAVLCGAPGCGSSAPVERRAIGLGSVSGDAAGAEERVAWSPAWESAWEPGPERGRLDAKLASGEAARSYPLDLYPTAGPSLDTWRWLYLPRNPDAVLYFRPRVVPGYGR